LTKEGKRLKVKLGLFLMSVLLIVLGIKVFSDPLDKRLEVYLEGKAPERGIAALRDDGRIYLNLSFLREVFHVNTIWRQAEDRLYFKLGKAHYTFHSGSKEYTEYVAASAKRSLRTAPLFKNGELWLPLEFFLKLGLVQQKQTGTQLFLSWDGNYLLGIENALYRGRPAFLAEGSRELKAIGYYSQKPDRFVCKFSGTKPYPLLNTVFPSHYPGVKTIRWTSRGRNSMLLTLELAAPNAVKIVKVPGDPKSLYIVPNYTVQDVFVRKNGIERMIFIKTSAPAEYRYQFDKTRRQMAITFSGADLTAGIPKNIPGAGNWAQSIRVDRMDNHCVTVTVKLRGAEPCYVGRSRYDAGLVEVKNRRRITAVNCLPTKAGVDLTLRGDGELSWVADAFAEPGKLRIDLEPAQWASGLAPFIPVAGEIRSLQLTAPTPSTARLVIAAKYLTGYDWEITPDGRQLTFHLRRSPLNGKTVVIDPGHGGMDFSACGKRDTAEKTVNFETAVKLHYLLEQAGARVILTRRDDTFISLYERSFLANRELADLFISIHANYAVDTLTRGMEFFYHPERPGNKQLAEAIAEKLRQYTGLTNRGALTGDFAVLRETNMPGILIELGYLSNYQEEAILRDAGYQKNAAWGIFQGIVAYYGGLN
jgi:N-acetylmuramoyl-L-alanine amidase